MIDKLFLTSISLLYYSMKDVGNINLDSLRPFLQIFISGMIILKFIAPYFHNADTMAIALFIVPILFIGTGYIFNKLYYLYTSNKV